MRDNSARDSQAEVPGARPQCYPEKTVCIGKLSGFVPEKGHVLLGRRFAWIFARSLSEYVLAASRSPENTSSRSCGRLLPEGL